ncbi:MAG: hypothetical protein KHX56_01620 [Clostridiales bacterium]|nr:hypothetical protein [Clostridiales bacterium]
MKKLLSLFLFSLLIIISIPNDSYAMAEGSNDTFTADEATNELTEFVENLGIDINTVEKFQVISNSVTRSNTSTNALMITSSEEDSTIIHVIAGFDDTQGKISPADVVTKESATLRSSKGYTWIPKSNTVTVAASVAFNTYGTSDLSQAYYNPYYCQVYYANTSGYHSVSNISAKYRSVGVPYSYPGLQPLSTSTVLHAIDVNQYSPAEWQVYSKTNYYSSGPSRVLRITIPSYSEAMGLDLSITVDGTTYTQYYGVTP